MNSSRNGSFTLEQFFDWGFRNPSYICSLPRISLCMGVAAAERPEQEAEDIRHDVDSRNMHEIVSALYVLQLVGIDTRSAMIGHSFL